MEIDLGPFIAALVVMAGGEIKVPYDLIANPQAAAIEFAFEDDGATVVLTLTEEVPDE